MTLGSQAFQWIRLAVPQETELRAQETLEHLSACFLLTMCWEAESGDSKRSNHFTGEIHSTENATRVLGVGSCSSHQKERFDSTKLFTKRTFSLGTSTYLLPLPKANAKCLNDLNSYSGVRPYTPESCVVLNTGGAFHPSFSK